LKYPNGIGNFPAHIQRFEQLSTPNSLKNQPGLDWKGTWTCNKVKTLKN
jgi:hypothetical protein